MTVTLHCGDNRIILRTMADSSVDAIVCDPPYELGFMGKRWDSSGIAYDPVVWSECLRVLKPGGHLIAFGGTRTYHRMTVAIEDAGFEIRDCLLWLYGSGFPKSLDVSKAIDKQAGAERSEGARTWQGGKRSGGIVKDDEAERTSERTIYDVPATSQAQQWHGFGTALKPAHEPAVLARKPLTGTVADNVMAWGTGALNIDGCRVTYDGKPPTGHGSDDNLIYGRRKGNDGNETSPLGRWPANLILDEEAAALLDAQSGVSRSSAAVRNNGDFKSTSKGYERAHITRGHDDTGGASRFFYTAKASRAEREAGLEGMEVKQTGAMQGNVTGGRVAGDGRENPEVKPVHRANHHPTVKPLDLMRYLVRLVTPPGGIVLDPFMGSGSTGCAAVLEGMSFIGIDITPEYVEIARRRIAHHGQQPPLI